MTYRQKTITPRTPIEKAHFLFQSAGIKSDPLTAANDILILADEIRRELHPRRTRTQFTPGLLAQADKLHNEDNLSIRQVADQLHCDRKVLSEKMTEAGIHVRDQKQSQRARRDLELELTKGDVMEWGAHEFFRNGK